MKKIGLIGCLLAATFFGKAQEKTLGYFIEKALTNSPLLKDYNNQQRVHLIDSLQILAGYKPQVNGISSNNYAPVIGGWGYDGAITNGTNFSQLVTVTKLLVSKENLNNQQEAIRLLNESLKTSGKITEQELIKTITAQYISCFGDYQQWQFNKEVLALFKKEQSILKNLTEKSVYRQTDYLSFLVTMQQQELQISQIHNQYQNDYSTLHYLCGLRDTVAMPIQQPDIVLNSLPDVEHSVFYQQFLNDSLQLKNSAALIEYQYKPKVNLFGDGGYLTSFSEGAYKNFGLSFGVNLTVPIYDGRQKKMKQDKLSIAEQSRINYRDHFKNQYNQQIAQLLQQLNSTKQLIQQSNEQIRFAETLVEANQKLLETGDARMTDYILAIGNYMNAKNTVTLNTINQLQIINQINYWNRK